MNKKAQQLRARIDRGFIGNDCTFLIEVAGEEGKSREIGMLNLSLIALYTESLKKLLLADRNDPPVKMVK